METKEIFTDIYKNNSWGSPESRSGSGSELKNTVTLRNELPFLFKKYNIKSIFDAACGDFNWMQHVEMNDIDYSGGDIVEQVVKSNQEKHPEYKFQVFDIINDIPPQVDLIIARDVISHLDFASAHRALHNLRHSGSKYLLATSFTRVPVNHDIRIGEWRPINFMLSPYLQVPIYLINENCTEAYPHYIDKCLILSKLS